MKRLFDRRDGRFYKIALLLLCLMTIVPMQAQWSAGGKAGINWSTVRFPKNILDDKADYIMGGQVGLVLTYQFNRYFDMRPIQK